MKYLLLTFMLLLPFQTLLAEDIALFDSEGKAIAYIDTEDDDLTIYMYNGKPVAYLYPESRGDAFCLYGFNGKHLGWFEKGVARDHDGCIVGFQKGAINHYTSYEPYKSYKQYKPYKDYRSYAPYKPYSRSTFSSTSLSLFLMRGKK